MFIVVSLACLALSLYMMQAEIKEQFCKLYGFTVMGKGFKKKHYSLTCADALEWLGCYDNATMYKGRRLYSEKRTLKG
jgi:hypothetical protein